MDTVIELVYNDNTGPPTCGKFRSYFYMETSKIHIILGKEVVYVSPLLHVKIPLGQSFDKLLALQGAIPQAFS